MSAGEPIKLNHHTAMPARPDLIRLSLGIIGIGTSGPLIAMSTMPVLALIFWRNLGGSLLTLPFALRQARDRNGVKWAVVAGVILALHFVGFFSSGAFQRQNRNSRYGNTSVSAPPPGPTPDNRCA